MNTTTPMLQQYQQIKSKHKDCILFFRLGDFYEMFYEDAKVGSRVLDLVLTSRGKGTANIVPMCGIPFHSAEGYIAKLIKSGHKVAICEQVENPAEAKGIVKRDVIRIITSGTYLDDNTSDARYILCVAPNAKKEKFGVAFIDPASGTIRASQYDSPQQTLELISRLPVYECVYPEQAEDSMHDLFNHPLLKTKTIVRSPHEDWCFNPEIAHKSLCEHFKVHNLRGFGIEEMQGAVSSCGALLEYLRQMNKQPLRHIDRISLYADSDYVFISPAASYGLELEQLFKTINTTQTAPGKRKLHYWLYHPLKQPAAVLQRQAAVKILKDTGGALQNLKEILRQVPDLEKCVSKLSCGYTHPKDILAIRNALCLFPEIKTLTEPLFKKNRLFELSDIPDLRQKLDAAVNPDMPLSKNEGKVIRPGFHQELDELRDIQENGRQWLRQYQEREIKRTGINSMKVGFNKIFGYYIEVTKANAKLVPEDFIRKQTLVNAERYITPELKEYEEKILTAQDKIIKIENELLRELQAKILDHSLELHNYARQIATIDALAALANLSLMPQYIAPEIAEDFTIDIHEGRHPVVEQSTPDPFVPNDILLDQDKQHLIILTGPNMAGKSTYIRQIAVLVILAQMGSYIPAKSARIGVVDKIFTRIGAQDDIAKGQSTFMVEMNETADIVSNLTERSLIILDEIGRGTSTFDGLSLAWALAEHFQKTRARTLFATHFHELTALADEHSGVKNYNVAVKEWKDEIVFLHKIVPGSSDDSYGIYVAKLAGLPSHVIGRSKEILTQLELQSNLKEKLGRSKRTEDQLSLFVPQVDQTAEELKKTIEKIDINNLTPVEALNLIQELKEKLSKGHRSHDTRHT